MNSVIKDVVKRTNGELYIGVVGSVRSGKSMFIRKFIQTKVLPFVTDEETKNKIIDEVPQSSDGKVIMTTEPKFVPSNPTQIVIEEDIVLNIRLVDCVGYVIKSAKGYLNEDMTPKLVKTPWYSDDIPFVEAAELGTKKVMENHSNIGIVITSDGSFSDFTRNEYAEVENTIVEEMKKLNKPFVIILNTTEVNSKKTLKLVDDLEKKYDVKVLPININELSETDIDKILSSALEEFEISKLDINVPTWISSLDNNNPYKIKFNNAIDEASGKYRKFKEVKKIKESLKTCELFSEVEISELDSSTGNILITINCKEELYDSIVYDLIGDVIEDKGKFITFITEAINNNKTYEKYKTALEEVKSTGYGIATPDIIDMELKSPEVIKQGSRYGIRLRAIAPSIHLIRVDVESTFEPIIGSEEQSKKLLDKIMSDYEVDPFKMWDSEIFGRKLSEVVNDGIRAKLYLLPDNIQYKLKECLEKIVNKGKGGILAIIL